MASPTTEVSFSDLGIPVSNGIATVRFLGKVRRWSSLAAYEKWLLILSNVSLLGVLVFTCYAIAKVTLESDRTYAIVIAFNLGICFIYIWKGVLQENPSTMVIFVVGAVVLCSYIIGNFVQVVTQTGGFHASDHYMDVKLARLVLLLAAAVPIVVLSLKASFSYYGSKNLIFRTVGANLAIQSACEALHVAQSLLLCDYQLAASLIILGYNQEALCAATDNLRTALLAVGIVFSLAWLLLGYFAMPREHRVAMYVFWALSVLSPAFLVYHVYCISNEFSHIHDQNFINAASFICAAFGIVVRFLVIVWTARVYRNFGRGLKTRDHSSDDGHRSIITSSQE